MINQNWPRWIFASFSKYFATLFTSNNLYYFIEGEDRQTRSLDKFVEFRLDGPVFDQVSKLTYKTKISINVLISCALDSENSQTLQAVSGIVASMFEGAVDTFKYLGEDDPEYLACFTRESEVIVNQYGQIDPNIPLLQATVEGDYSALLRN